MAARLSTATTVQHVDMAHPSRLLLSLSLNNLWQKQALESGERKGGGGVVGGWAGEGGEGKQYCTWHSTVQYSTVQYGTVAGSLAGTAGWCQTRSLGCYGGLYTVHDHEAPNHSWRGVFLCESDSNCHLISFGVLNRDSH
jgi:hypothetical protein